VLTVAVEHLLSLGQADKGPEIATALKMRLPQLSMGVLSGGPTALLRRVFQPSAGKNDSIRRCRFRNPRSPSFQEL
jgi:hypothetical protein